MRHKATPPATPLAQQDILDWLARPGEGDALVELVPLHFHVTALNQLNLPSLHRLKILELLQQRAEQLDGMLLPLLLDAKLPLPGQLADVAQGLIDVRTALSDAWMQIAVEAPATELVKVRRSTAGICLQGLGNLQRLLLTTLLIANPVPLRLWRSIQTLYHGARDAVDPTATLPVEVSLADARFKSMLALAASQPEGLAPREIAFLGDYATGHAAAIQIDPNRPEASGDWFWIEASLDQPPVALARREPSPGKCLYFRCGELADLAGEHLEKLADGTSPADLGLPIQAAGPDYRNALERARQHWSAPRHRHYNRREKNIRVEVCTHLSTLWTALGGATDDAPRATTCNLTTSHWTLLNEGPAGYAMVHVEGKVAGLVPGGAVGLRTGDGAAWQICVVRWARSESSEHVELGLEVLAPSAQAVRLQTHGQGGLLAPVPALLLPALPGLNRSEAILSARGDYNALPFTLLLEADERLQVIECMPRRSLVETSSVEVFEFLRKANTT